MYRVTAIMLMFLALSGCGASQKNEWEDLDYSPVYKKAQGREFDPSYTPAGGCVDDDLGCR